MARLASTSHNALFLSSVKAASTDSGSSFSCPTSLGLKIYPPQSGWIIARDFALFASLLPLSTLKLMQDGLAPQSLSSLRRFFTLADASRHIEESMTGTLTFLEHPTFSSHNLWLPLEGSYPICSNGFLLVNGVCQARRAYKIASVTSSLSIDTSTFGATTLTDL